MISNSIDNIEIQTPIMHNLGGMYDCVIYTDGKIIDNKIVEDYNITTFFVSERVKTKNTYGIKKQNLKISNANYIVLAYYTYKWVNYFRKGVYSGGGWEKVFSDVIIKKCDATNKACLKEIKKVIKDVKYIQTAHEFPISDFGTKISFETEGKDKRICVLKKSKYRKLVE